MAIVPRGKESARIEPSNPVPIASTGDARIIGDSVASIGKSITRFAEQQIEFDRALKYQEGTSEIQNIATEAKSYADLNSAKDGSDYKQKFAEFSKPRIDEVFNKYAGYDPDLRRNMTSYIKRVQAHIDTETTIASAKMLEQSNFERLGESIKLSSGRVYERPDENMVASELLTLGATIDEITSSGGLNPLDAAKARNAHFEELAINFVEGLENRKEYGRALNFLTANQADPNFFTEIEPSVAKDLGFIDSTEQSSLENKGERFKVPIMSDGDKVQLTDSMALINNSLSPQKKIRLIEKMKAQMDQEARVSMADLNASLSGFEAVALNGSRINPQDVAALKSRVNDTQNMTLDARRRVFDRINGAVAVNEQLQVLANSPRDKWNGLRNGLDTRIKALEAEAASFDPRLAGGERDFAIQANRAEMKDKFEAAMRSLAKRQNEDPVSEILKSDNHLETMRRATLSDDEAGHASTKDYVTRLLNKQDYLQIPKENQKVLSLSEANALASTLKALDPESMSQELDGMEQKYGDHFPRVISDMALVDKDVEYLKNVIYAPHYSRGKLIDSYKNMGEINKTFKSDPNTKGLEKRVDQAVSSVMSPVKNTFLSGQNDTSNISQANAMHDQIRAYVKRELVRDPNQSESALAERGFQEIFGASFDIVSGGNSSVIVPHQMSGMNMDKGMIADYMVHYSSPDGLREMNVLIPKRFKDSPVMIPDSKISSAKFYASRFGAKKSGVVDNRPTDDLYLDWISQNGRWVTNKDGSGVTLMSPDRDGVFLPVKKKTGENVTANYRDITYNPPKSVRALNSKTLRSFRRRFD